MNAQRKVAVDFIAALEAENEALREKLAWFEEIFRSTIWVPPAFGLTSAEAKIFALLLKRDQVSREAAMVALYEDGGPDIEINIINVRVCTMRAKLKPFGIGIETVWGVGYRMSPEAKARAKAHLEQAPRVGT